MDLARCTRRLIRLTRNCRSWPDIVAIWSSRSRSCNVRFDIIWSGVFLDSPRCSMATTCGLTPLLGGDCKTWRYLSSDYCRRSGGGSKVDGRRRDSLLSTYDRTRCRMGGQRCHVYPHDGGVHSCVADAAERLASEKTANLHCEQDLAGLLAATH